MNQHGRSASSLDMLFQANAGDSPQVAYLFAGSSEAISAARRSLVKAIEIEGNVLLAGTSGTGKEWTARYLHARSSRHEQPFIVVDCASKSADELSQELFGNRINSMGAVHEEPGGQLAEAAAGTLYLRDIDAASLDVQDRILYTTRREDLRQQHSSEGHSPAARIIAASDIDLSQCLRNGDFRAELYAAISESKIAIPMLGDRPEDLKLLVEAILDHGYLAARPSKLTPGAVRVLQQHAWPGNTRELATLLERLGVLFDRACVDIEHLPSQFTDNVSLRDSDRAVLEANRVTGPQPQDFDLPTGDLPLKEYLGKIEVSLIRRALHATDGVVAHAADVLKIRRTTLAEKIKRYDLTTGRD